VFDVWENADSAKSVCSADMLQNKHNVECCTTYIQPDSILHANILKRFSFSYVEWICAMSFLCIGFINYIKHRHMFTTKHDRLVMLQPISYFYFILFVLNECFGSNWSSQHRLMNCWSPWQLLLGYELPCEMLVTVDTAVDCSTCNLILCLHIFHNSYLKTGFKEVGIFSGSLSRKLRCWDASSICHNAFIAVTSNSCGSNFSTYLVYYPGSDLKCMVLICTALTCLSLRACVK